MIDVSVETENIQNVATVTIDEIVNKGLKWTINFVAVCSLLRLSTESEVGKIRINAVLILMCKGPAELYQNCDLMDVWNC